MRWRKMTWVLIIWTVLFGIWMVAGAAGNDCAKETTDLNTSACQAGTGIGVALIFFLWFIGFIVLALVWFMTRPKGRQCPACGEDVKKGRTDCPKCGYDFAAAAAQPAVTAAVPAPPPPVPEQP